MTTADRAAIIMAGFASRDYFNHESAGEMMAGVAVRLAVAIEDAAAEVERERFIRNSPEGMRG